jgi:hypothetical protein
MLTRTVASKGIYGWCSKGGLMYAVVSRARRRLSGVLPCRACKRFPPIPPPETTLPPPPSHPLPTLPENPPTWNAVRMYCVRMNGRSCFESIWLRHSEKSDSNLPISSSDLPAARRSASAWGGERAFGVCLFVRVCLACVAGV